MNNVQHHIIPKSYLSQWCDKNTPVKQEPYLWVFDKKTNSCKKKAPSSKFFCENNFYTVYKEDHSRNLSIEYEFGIIENNFVKVRDTKLLKHKMLTFEEKFQVCLFIAILHTRTKQGINNLSRIFKPLSKKLKSMVDSKGLANNNDIKYISEDTEEIITFLELNDIIDNPIKHLMPSSIDIKIKSLIEFNMAVFYTKKENKFITTDNPCILFDSQSNIGHPSYQSPRLNNESTEVVLPISPTHCIVLERKGINGYVNIDENPSTIDIINTLLYKNSDKYYYSNSNKKIYFLKD